jgi:tRNA threonylcarbamoyl adenosine modification protein (Sua5/YciO/YrdC/YwlC family)
MSLLTIVLASASYVRLLPVRSRVAVGCSRRAETATMNMRSRRASRQPTQFLEVQADGSDMWRASGAIEALERGGCGVLPTDVSYSFVAPLSSKDGTKRILALKGARGEKKPLSLLCRSLADVEEYTKGVTREGFKLLKSALPGPFTFIMPASASLPRGIYKDGARQWKRDTVGVRMPDDPVCLAVLEALDEPLLCSTVPTGEAGDQLACSYPLEGSESASWCTEVDFVLDGGPRPSDGSTVYDLSGDPADGLVLVREGLGRL